MTSRPEYEESMAKTWDGTPAYAPGEASRRAVPSTAYGVSLAQSDAFACMPERSGIS
jgi:hypothetical protein